MTSFTHRLFDCDLHLGNGVLPLFGTEDLLRSVAVTMILIALAGIAFAFFGQGPLLEVMRYEKTPHYLFYLMAILGLDAVSAIPFARLRRENKAWRFAGIKLASFCLMWPSTLHLPARILGVNTVLLMVDARSAGRLHFCC